jgi:prophage regulatory protein
MMTDTSNVEPKRKLFLLKLNAVRIRTKLSVPSIYRLIKEGVFPKPLKMGERAVAWVEDEIEEWLQAKLEERGKPFNRVETPKPAEETEPRSINPLLNIKASENKVATLPEE